MSMKRVPFGFMIRSFFLLTMAFVFMLSGYVSVSLAESGSPALVCQISLDRTIMHYGQTVTATWNVTGGSEPYQSVTYGWYKTSSFGDGWASSGYTEAVGSHTYHPSTGGTCYLVITVKEADGVITEFQSDTVTIEGEPEISVTLSKTSSMYIGQPLKATWAITGGKAPYDVFFTWDVFYDAGSTNLDSGNVVGDGSSTVYPYVAGRCQLYMEITDANGLQEFYYSPYITVTQKPPANRPVTSISLNFKKITIGVGQSVSSIHAVVSPANATNKKIIWTSKSPSVVTVDSKGKITGLKTGTATVTAIAADGSGKTASVTVTVVSRGKGVTAIKLSKTSATIYEKETLTLKARLTPSSPTNKTVQWFSSNTEVAKVSSTGVVTGVKKGTATITAVSSSGISAQCQVTIAEVPVSSLKMSKTRVTVLIGSTYQLTAKVLPTNAKNKLLTWFSSNTKVATVSADGKVTANGAGKATITVRSSNGKVAICIITVKPTK